MELRKFIKCFTWTELDRSRITLGPGTRIDPEINRACLGTYGVDEIPTDPDLFVKSWIANPTAVKAWLGFQAVIIHKKDFDGNIVTSAAFRLSDGTDQYFWDGAAWGVSGINWNTEEEVATNIGAFPVTSRKLQIVVNLRTTDDSYSPELEEIRVLYGALIDSEVEDVLERSLIPALRESVQPVTRLVITKSGSDNTIVLPNYVIETDYRLVAVDAVFNHTDDPAHDSDLFESNTLRSVAGDPWHDGTIDVITLNALVEDGKTVWLRVRYEPVVAISTNQDWYEVGHVPAIIIERVLFEGSRVVGEDFVGNKADGSAFIVPAPLQGSLSFELLGIASSLADHEALSAEVNRFFASHDPLVSTGIDEPYRLWLVDEHEHLPSPAEEELYSCRKRARIMGFRIWDKPAADGYLVRRFQVIGSAEVTIE